MPKREARTRMSNPFADVAFGLFIVVFAALTLTLLGAGITAVVAARSPDAHAWLHELALGEGLGARIAHGAADASHDLQPPLQIAIDYLFGLLSLTLAGLLLWLRPHDRAARLLVIGFLGSAAMFNIQANAVYAASPVNQVDSMTRYAYQLIAGLAYIYALLLFPDGKLIPRRSGWVLALIYGPVTLGFAVATYEWQSTTHRLFIIVFFGLVAPLAGVISQFYRYRRSFILVEQQQARLLFWALTPALVVGLFVLTQGVREIVSPGFEGRPVTQLPAGVFRLFTGVFSLMPVALFLGLIRFRLWDIDRVVNRTLVYGVLISILGGLYWGTVVILQGLFNQFTRKSDLAVAASTLAVAALFRPLRGQVRDFIDKRFYRTHYDMARTIEAFSATLRRECDLPTLRGQLQSLMAQTVQPTAMTLWLRAPETEPDVPLSEPIEPRWLRSAALDDL